MSYIIKLEDVNLSHHHLVGGKNASLGELIHHLKPKGVNVIQGYATTITLYQDFIKQNQLESKIANAIAKVDGHDIAALENASAMIQQWILAGHFPDHFEEEVAVLYKNMNAIPLAIRSSSTAEDLVSASFAGQQESYLNIKGLNNVILAIKKVFASLYTSRAISYRLDQNIHENVAISVGIQPMVRSDKAVSGVMFTLDTESGFDQVILLTASYGLGEAIVQGKVNTDEFYISKPILKQNKYAILQKHVGDKTVKMINTQDQKVTKSIKSVQVNEIERMRYCLTDDEIHTLARYALMIEEHYGKHMDIEWAKDGLTNELIILQARPETVKSKEQNQNYIEHYHLVESGDMICEGQSVGQRIGTGYAKVILDPKKMHELKPGHILVTDMTDPDWEPVLKHAAGIVTNRGGRTCHAAIIARELGIPAVVGCKDATQKIKNDTPVTVACSQGQKGIVYQGNLKYEIKKIPIQNLPTLPVNLCINLGNPEKAFSTQFLPNKGVGLARIEFIISNMIGIHPNALNNFEFLPNKLKQQISKKTMAYDSPIEFYIEKLREGISTIAAAFSPKPVIFRFSDFKSNEYKNLLGGENYEPKEENPMIGFRGAARYNSALFKESFALECKAFARVRDKMGLLNAQLMLPFVRTVEELKETLRLLELYGLKRGENSLKIIMMCEVPSNALLAEEFLEHVDGFSIGSNDLTQLTLGIDRDSSLVAPIFNESDPAVKKLISHVINECKRKNKYIGICGQGASDHIDFAKWLLQEGIESISLNADTILETWTKLHELSNKDSILVS